MTGETSFTIKLEDGADPIAGVIVSGGEESPFVGWIELAGLVEARRVPPPGGDSSPATHPPEPPTVRPASPPAS